MNLYSQYILTLFLTALTALSLAIFVFFQKIRSDIKFSFTFYCLCLFVWGSGQLLALNEKNQLLSTFFVRNYCHTGVIFIPILLIHFVFSVLDKTQQKKRLLLACYAIGIILVLLNNFTDLVVKGVALYPPIFGYVYLPGLLHPLMVFFFALFAVYGNVLLYQGYRSSSGSKRLQLKYLFFATLLSYIGGSPNFLLGYRIQIPLIMPFGTYVMPAYAGILTYAIVKHRLMDIRVAVTRAGIFLAVYCVVLGFPFWYGSHTHNWFHSTIIMLVLATVGPVFYGRLSRHAEERLQKRQLMIRRALREFAETLPQVKETKKLLNEICEGAYEIIEPEFCGVYVHNGEDKYVLRHSLFRDKSLLPSDFNKSEPLLSVLALKRGSFSLGEENLILPGLPQETFFIPFWRKNEVHGFLVLGPRPGKTSYDSADIDIFEILSAQVSLALENCLFWEDEKMRLAREEQIRRHSAMDNFSLSIAHEILNPTFSAECAIKSMIKQVKKTEIFKRLTPEEGGIINEKVDAALFHLSRVTKMITAVKEFAGQTKGELALLSVDELIEDFLTIIKPQIILSEIKLGKEVQAGLYVDGNKIWLEESLVNLTINAIHAVKDNVEGNRKIGLKAYSIKIPDNETGKLRIEITDNGYGIKKGKDLSREKDFIEDIFLDFVTTKASTEGTGMGLPRVRKIVERHKGRVWAESEGEGKGAKFIIEMPLAKQKAAI